MQCMICQRSEKDDVLYGEFKQKGCISVHYFCLLLSSGLSQNGSDRRGILGFLPSDIKAEAKRVSQLRCYFCRKISANIGCCVAKCRHVYHLHCGIKNNCLFEFYDEFQSFCNNHYKQRINQTIPYSMNLKHFSNNSLCTICCEKLDKYNEIKTILAPCCKAGWFHQLCLSKCAKNAGYFFKCPLCNNAEEFRKHIVKLGIYIPDQDASWELEPNAFTDLLERPNECEADICKCRGGRTHEDDNNELLYCTICGAHCIHKFCWKQVNDFICTECSTMTCINNAKIIDENINNNDKNNNNDNNDNNNNINTINEQSFSPSCSTSSSDLAITKFATAITSFTDNKINNNNKNLNVHIKQCFIKLMRLDIVMLNGLKLRNQKSIVKEIMRAMGKNLSDESKNDVPSRMNKTTPSKFLVTKMSLKLSPTKKLTLKSSPTALPTLKRKKEVKRKFVFNKLDENTSNNNKLIQTQIFNYFLPT